MMLGASLYASAFADGKAFVESRKRLIKLGIVSRAPLGLRNEFKTGLPDSPDIGCYKLPL